MRTVAPFNQGCIDLLTIAIGALQVARDFKATATKDQVLLGSRYGAERPKEPPNDPHHGPDKSALTLKNFRVKANKKVTFVTERISYRRARLVRAVMAAEPRARQNMALAPVSSLENT